MSCGRIIGAILVVATIGGCVEIVRRTGDEVDVDTGQIGNIAPGLMDKLGWPAARGYCKDLGKVPRIKDIAGSVVTYRCVEPE